MKMQLTLNIETEDCFEEKFKQYTNEFPNIGMDLVRVFGQSLVLAFRMNEQDGVKIQGFSFKKIEEKNIESEKKVDS